MARSRTHRAGGRGANPCRRGTGPQRRADAAWAAADTLTAAAVAVAGELGGPITEAAETFDRAGRDCYRRIPQRSDTGTALRTASRMIALLAPATSHAGTHLAAVSVALAALATAVGDLRRPQARLHQVDAAMDTVQRLRHLITARPARPPANAADLAVTSFPRVPRRARTGMNPSSPWIPHERPVDKLRRDRRANRACGPRIG
jgi:hypothetical protein